MLLGKSGSGSGSGVFPDRGFIALLVQPLSRNHVILVPQDAW